MEDDDLNSPSRDTIVSPSNDLYALVGSTSQIPVSPSDVQMSEQSNCYPIDDDGETIPLAEAVTEAAVIEEKETKKETRAVPFGDLFRFADRDEKLLLFAGIVGALGCGGISPCFSLIFGQIIDNFNSPGTDFMKNISDSALVFVYLGIGMFAGGFLELNCLMLLGERLSKRVRELYLHSLLRQEIGWHDLQNTGDLSVKLTSDTRKFQDGIGDKLGQVIQQLATFIAGLTIAFYKGWELTLVILAIAPALVICAAIMGFIMQNSSAVEQKAYGKAGTVAQESLGAIRTVHAQQEEPNMIRKYSLFVSDAYAAGLRKALSQGLGIGAFLLVIFSVYGFGLWYGSTLIRDGKDSWPGTPYTGGSVIAVFYSLVSAVMSMGQAAPHLGSIAAACSSAVPLYEVIDRKSNIDAVDDVNGLKVSAKTITGKIVFSDVSFKYPSRQESLILDKLSMTFFPNTMTALVGASGCGKSTIIQLVERFYDPDEGTVEVEVCIDKDDHTRSLALVNGEIPSGGSLRMFNLKDINVASWRRSIGLVGQEPVLFSGTVSDNIRYGNPDASDDDIIACAKLANAHDFITRLQDGYDSNVGEGAKLLSGGQKQRVAISRALIREPSVLLLDEATSALDNKSERVVQEALDSLLSEKVGRTSIVIAHRLTTIRNADRIVVLDRGVILEDGSHDQLMEREGAYSSLIKAQDAPTEGGDKKTDELVEEDPNKIIEPVETLAPVPDSKIENLHLDANIKHPHGRHVPADTAAVKRDLDVIEHHSSIASGSPISRVVSMCATEWRSLTIGVIGGIGEGSAFPLFSLLMSAMTNSFYGDVDDMMDTTQLYAVFFFLVGVGSFCCVLLKFYLFGKIGEKLVFDVRKQTFTSMMRQEIGWHDVEKNSAGTLVTKLSSDAGFIRTLIADRFGTITSVGSSLITSIVISMIKGWQMALVMIAVYPFMVGAGVIHFKIISGQGAKSKKSIEAAGQIATESVSSLRTVASFNGEAPLINRFSSALVDGLNVGKKTALVSGIGFGGSFFITFSSYAGSFYAGGRLVDSGYITFEEMLAVFMIMQMSAMMIAQLFQLAPDFDKASAAISDIFEIMDRQPVRDFTQTTGTTPNLGLGEVRLHNVFFHYPTRPDVRVLMGTSFFAEGNKMLAVVGESGCGKSTVFNLIQRHYDTIQFGATEAYSPKLQQTNIDVDTPVPFVARNKELAGYVSIDGHDIAEMNLNHLRRHIGVVSQEPVLFSGTIGENIRCGDDSITEDQVQEAAKLANIHDLIMSRFPLKYDTQVGPKGSQLSGGQKARVAIARALVRKPTILLLDEATAALDNKSERLVQDALNKAMQGRTTIIIAHRLDTIKNADKIVVVSEGKVCEEGTHTSLLAANGVYARLVGLAAMNNLGSIE